MSIGPNWKATYSADGVVFTPALGKAAPRTHRLGFEFLGATRGGQPLADLRLSTEPALLAGAVEFARGSGLVERYEALAQGLEQSFVFDSLPGGRGELVVRGRLTTSLPQEHRLAPDALRFDAPGEGGVSLDQIVGIDAHGRRAPGTLRRSGDVLELVLPAEFVDSAALPLVLDPLFGALVQLDDAGIDRDQIDVASAGAPTGLYGFVHSRYYSATDPDITLYTASDPTATLFSPTAIETTIGTFDQIPRIAYNRDADAFGIVWERRSTPSTFDAQVLCSSYALSSGVVQPTVLVESGAFPAVSGDSFAGFPQIVVVWTEFAEVRSKAVALSSTAPPAPDPTFNMLYGPGARSQFALSADPGVAGRHLLALRDGGSFLNDALSLRFLDLNGAAIGSSALGLSISDPFADLNEPDVAGDGDSFLLTYTRTDLTGSGDSDVIARRIDYDPAVASGVALDPVEIEVAADSSTLERTSAVARSGDRYLVAWAEGTAGPVSTGAEVWSRTFDLDGEPGCAPSEQVADLASAAADRVRIAATEESGDLVTGEAAIGLSTDGGDLFFHLWEETAALPPANIGGGCGPAMDFELTGDTALGSDDLIADLRVFDPAPTFAILNVAAGGVEFPCSTCIWVPLRTTVLVALEPSAGGTRTGSTPLQVPCNPAIEGAFVDLQFTVLPTTLSPCALSPNLGISDRLRVTFAY